jgi:choline kinase
MHVVIMAAGLGNRLGGLTAARPKALVPVAGRELVLRALDFTDHPSVEERTVVTGYRGDRLANFIRNSASGVGLLHNPRFEEGSILTLEVALSAVAGDMLLMNVDHIYPRRMFHRIADAEGGISAVCDFGRSLGPDDMKVRLGGDGRLAEIDKGLASFSGGYIGMTLCRAGSLPAYRRAAARAREARGEKANAEAVLAQLAAEGSPINICDASGMPWLEVDTPDELAHAERTLRENPEFLA